jgi:hypothetical protein
MISKMGLEPILRRGLGISSVKGANRLPNPPAIKKQDYFFSHFRLSGEEFQDPQF